MPKTYAQDLRDRVIAAVEEEGMSRCWAKQMPRAAGCLPGCA